MLHSIVTCSRPLSLAFFIHSWITTLVHMHFREGSKISVLLLLPRDNALWHIQFITFCAYIHMNMQRQGMRDPVSRLNFSTMSPRSPNERQRMHASAIAWVKHLSEKLCTFYSLIRSLSLFSPRSFLDRHLVTIDIRPCRVVFLKTLSQFRFIFMEFSEFS